MANSLVVKLLCLVIVCLALAGSPKAKAAVTCGQVVNFLSPCIPYVTTGGPTVPAQCCNGIRALYAQAQTTPDRQAVCTCIKNAVNGAYNNNNVNNAAGLPKKCGLNIPYQISPSTDCSRVR